MNSLYKFLIKPVNKRYNNEKKVGDKTLVINTKIENHRFVSREAVVVSTPLAFKSKIKPGDIVIVHFNVFRRFYDIRDQEKDSSSYFKDDLYFCDPYQIYLYKRDDKWMTHLDYCFVKPIIDNNVLNQNKEKPLTGILKYSNNILKDMGVEEEDLVGFTPVSEFEFIVDNERFYCMKSNDIVIKHEYQGNEKEYNPSWAQGS
tara:strand:- start:1036 stop:1641 length:606 start_codon:yes stop_codon:yes gene_type:complete